MAAAWDLSDEYLANMLQAYRDSIAGAADLIIRLFKNDYVPVPGADNGSFTEADFPGYVSGAIVNSGWGNATITDHVASILHDTLITFAGDAGSWSPQTIYGYWVQTSAGNYFFSERFSTPIDMSPDGEIRITPRQRHKTAPA